MPFEILAIIATCTCKVISIKRCRTIGVGDGRTRKVSDVEFGDLWGNCGPSLNVEDEGSRCPNFFLAIKQRSAPVALSHCDPAKNLSR